MNLLRCIVLLQFTTTLALGQSAPQSKSLSLPKQPEVMVRSLYHEVVARHPSGIPVGADMKIFAPYLSKTLLHRIDLAVACGKDWDRQFPNPHLKPPFAWLESGLFSGDDEQAEPRDFHIERTQSEKDGSFRVRVRLTWGAPAEKPSIWRVVAIVLRENGQYVLDDIIYLKDDNREVDSRLSVYLSVGCDGPRWGGNGEHRDDLKRQR